MALDPTIRAAQHQIVSAATRHGAHNVRVFGSAARGQARPDSDVDLLVDLEPDRSLLDLGGLVQDLEEILGRRVDLVTERGLHLLMRDAVLRDAVPLEP